VLVLDEPTNDLDIETLDLLEELLLEFSGTLLLVSHDRAFLDSVVTSTLVLEGGGRVGEYAGGYCDWVRQREPADARAKPAQKRTAAAPAPRSDRKRRLTFKESAELSGLPDRIDALEQERQALYESLADVGFLRDGAAVARATARLAELGREIDELTSRWVDLETIASDA